MKKAIIAMVLFISALGFVFADEFSTYYMSVSYGTTNGAVTLSQTNVNVKGFIEEISVEVPSAVTANVSIVSSPVVGASVNLVTNNTTANLKVRPRVKTTDIAGTAGSTDTKYMVLGETIIFSVTNIANTVSNCTFKALIKTSNTGGV